MFSANNFYQWTYETYLQNRNFSMITYHPNGTRGYKNLKNHTYSAKNKSNYMEMLSNACVLMNDQEPVMLDSILSWKKTHIYPSVASCGTINDIYCRNQVENYFLLPEDQAKWSIEKENCHSLIEYFLSITTDKTFVSKLVLTGDLKPILVHSELNSKDVQELASDIIPVYVFWHALISRDWYRHWRLNINATPSINRSLNTKRFLLYARAWTGTREYRLKFIEEVIRASIHESIKYNFSTQDNGENYKTYKPNNPIWDIKNYQIENYFTVNSNKEVEEDKLFYEELQLILAEENVNDNKAYGSIGGATDNTLVNSNSSAVITLSDFTSTAISIVAETLFDTDKIHLTEKTFQPMVAGNPFIMLSAPGSLAILRNYGFKTFDSVWDESYDTIEDSKQRMQAVITLITKLHNLPQHEFTDIYKKCLSICEHNQKYFFSNEFERLLLDEYENNFQHAFEEQQAHINENPGGARFWIANEMLNGYNTDNFYKQDVPYLKYMLEKIKQSNEHQYLSILKQYPWAIDVMSET